MAVLYIIVTGDFYSWRQMNKRSHAEHMSCKPSPYTLYWQAEWQVPAFSEGNIKPHTCHLLYWCRWQHVPPVINGILKQLQYSIFLSFLLFGCLGATCVLTEDS
jgi:hypothetical protein